MRNKEYREIEKKFTVKFPYNLDEIDHSISQLFSGEIEDTIVGASKDLYWKPRTGQKRQDLVRLRELEAGRCELTYKWKDQGDNVNRVEVNVRTEDTQQLLAYQGYVHGRPSASVQKSYTVFHLNNKVDISTYIVENDPNPDRIFLEVEGPSLKAINAVIRILEDELDLIREKRSLFEIFRKKTKKKTRSLLSTLMRFQHP